MNSKCIVFLTVLGGLLLAHVHARPQVDILERQNNPINVIPDWVSNALQQSPTDVSPSPVDAVTIPDILAPTTTTRRPQLVDVIGNGLQGIFQGIIRAPGQIANRVQGILDQIIRRPAAPTVPAVPTTSVPIIG